MYLSTRREARDGVEQHPSYTTVVDFILFRQHLLDDLPVAFKLKRSVELPLDEEQGRKRFKADIFNYTMVLTIAQKDPMSG